MIKKTLSGMLRAAAFAPALLLGVLLGAPPATHVAALPVPGAIRLERAGAPRELPPKICGASSEAMIEHLIGNPAKVAALKELAPAILRFPGGSQSNFYDCKTGLLDFHENPQSSAYVRFWAQIAPKVARAFPKGVHLEDYIPLARELDADIILVPNLETSTVGSQAAWFKDLARQSILLKSIELGNEFWIAMASDPDSLRRWPDEPTSMAIMHRYEEVLRPMVGPGAKFAVQAAGSAFWVGPTARGPIALRLSNWDAALHSESWFEAVTLHLYPVLEPLQRLPGGGTHEGLFRYLMARCDGGVDRAIRDVSTHVPGKEIWITEWATHGGGDWAARSPSPVTPAMFAQTGTRMLLAMLRHPEVTRELFFTLNFDPSKQSYFVPAPDGSYRPEPVAEILAWFHGAANHGARLQRVVERGASALSPGVPFGDSYREVEGAVFVSAGETTLILQNSSATARPFDPADAGRLPSPKKVEIIATADLNSSERRGVQVNRASTASPFPVPAYSVVRIVWPGEVNPVPSTRIGWK